MVRILPAENETLEIHQNSEENNKKEITNQHIKQISRYSDNAISSLLTHVPTSDDRRENLECFFKLLKQDKFPTNNISFLLFLDVVKWFSVENTCQMRYTTITRNFWQVGFRLFHGKFLNFMRGLGNQGLVKKNKQKTGGIVTQLTQK